MQKTRKESRCAQHSDGEHHLVDMQIFKHVAVNEVQQVNTFLMDFICEVGPC